ncbi:polyprotein [Pyrenophora tritici-repentis]|uniref:Polyprotein n=1 Tax=Pyrenophora tritici-repentis TaxID=45151 RepID=A0A922N0E1_9PLEO|nr:polyprotein [Pyrenophora tritici-repentis]
MASSRRVVPTLEALLGTTNIKPREWHHIDPEIWEDNVEAPDDEVGITTATTYIARAIADYTDRPTADEELFWEFRQDFEGWTEAMFLRAQPIYTKELKRILRFKGVYTGRINMAPSESLARLLRMEEYLEWPQDVFQSAVFDTRSAAHMLQERALRQQRSEGSVQSTDRRLSSQAQSRTQTPVRTRGRDVDSRQTRDQDQTHARVQGRQETVEEEQQIQDQLAKTIEKAQNQPIRSQPVETTESAPQPAYQRVQSQQPPLTYNNFDRFREYTPAYPQRPKGLSVPPIVPSDDQCLRENVGPRQKVYGKPYDLLDDKLKIFYSICYHADIEPGQFHAVFPRILDGRAEEYYLHFVDQRMDTFLTAYTKLKNHFDTDVNHGHYYADWTTTSFVKVRRENPKRTSTRSLTSCWTSSNCVKEHLDSSTWENTRSERL